MEQHENNYTAVVETLLSMFGDVVSREVILAVVEHYNGDLENAAEAVITIASDGDCEMLNANKHVVNNEGANMTNNSAGMMTNVDTIVASETTNKTETVSDNNIPLANISAPTTEAGSVLANDNQMTYDTSSVSLRPSYAFPSSSHSTGAVPKQKPRQLYDNDWYSIQESWSNEIKDIVNTHHQGNRIMVVMRGAPGSGKSHLARQIIDMCFGNSHNLYRSHVFSTDDFFMHRGVYEHDKRRLSEAHDWNKRRVNIAALQGLSPIIVDNTNIEAWEMQPYIRFGVENGYIIEIVEPNTPWSKKASQLQKKTIHGVPLHTIRRYLDNFRHYTAYELITMFGLEYPADMVPPVKRNMPMVKKQNQATSDTKIGLKPVISSESLIKTDQESQPMSSKNFAAVQISPVNVATAQTSTLNFFNETSTLNVKNNEEQNDPPTVATSETKSNDPGPALLCPESEDAKHLRFLEIEKQLAEISKVEDEWDKGEEWDDISQTNVKDSKASDVPKPPRIDSQVSRPDENLLDTVKQCHDWSKISIFMPKWFETPSNLENETVEIPTISMKHAGTCMESGDTDLQNPKKVYKVLSASAKDINHFYIPPDKEIIPQKRMLDASTMTNDFVVTGAFRCSNEEQHFLSLRKMFKKIPKADLRYIFDNCCGDVNWAVEIILDGIASHQLTTVEDLPDSDTENDAVELCNCLAAYNIVPSMAPVPTVTSEKNIPDVSESVASTAQKKLRASPSEISVQLKRQIEQNVVIADNHYSEHCLKLRKWRRGELEVNNSSDNGGEIIPISMTDAAQALLAEASSLVATAPEFRPTSGENQQGNALKYDKPPTELVASNSFDSEDDDVDEGDDDSSYGGSLDDRESTVNISLGWDLIKRLDGMFGRENMDYPDNVVPNINIPVTLLNEINAFWIESLMFQMDDQDKMKTKLLKEDEEFARQIQMQEEELTRQGREPEVPDFKEIMDMDLALSLYQKQVAEWRKSEPNDMAARMTRDKLYNLFPELPKDVLAELLMAHDNNFKATVESLLISTGKASVLDSKNGLNKFVMERELARQQKLLEEEQQALSEVEWPLLPRGEKVEMSMVERYRKQADEHLQKRHQSYKNAESYIRRGIPQVAVYYSEVGHLHTRLYDHNSSLAAACLMQIHALNSPNTATVDLHFLRVAEARETLDLFIDTHIRKLQDSLAKGPNHQGPRAHKLFFITGRGAHSEGGRAKVKPAVRKRLRERGLKVSECNPGLLTTRVTAEDKLSYQVAA